MGTDIRLYVEVREDGKWRWMPAMDVLGNRDYGVFGFLADIRNYSHSPVISEPRGLPDDVSSELLAEHEPFEYQYCSHSWLTLAELQAYDYDRVFWDRRITRQTGPNSWDGVALAEEGEGEHLPLREFLGAYYFECLDRLAKLGDPNAVRIVFWFAP